uniref:MAM domain-containing protein n=1 Tax=Daphnia galeata TaxID=27404 RepID=A0A8J2WS79_9CRUS|nr:unnamed protein product [Daphnia galeata]
MKLKVFILAISIAISVAGRVHPVFIKDVVQPLYPFLEVDPITARSLLDNDFESGTEDPWYDSSPSTVHWIVEDFSTPTESYPAPAPLSGTKYLRAIRDANRTPGQLILRTIKFTAFPGDELSFDFWIRSRYTGGNALELVLSVDSVEKSLINLSGYSTSVNLEWRRSTVVILEDAPPTDVTLIFYGYCGANVDDAIGLDNIVLASLPTSSTPISFDGKDK